MQVKHDGQNYAPVGKSSPVCDQGEFNVGIIGLDHGHIYGMCNGLMEAGAQLALVYDPDPKKVQAFTEVFTMVKPVADPELIYQDRDIKMIATAAIPCNRAKICQQALLNGKHAFADKPGFTTLEHSALLKEAVRSSGKRFFIYFSERLHVESAVYAEKLIEDGAIGKVLEVQGFGPHRLNAPTRPAWFFDKEEFGGIITDIGCHQIEQIMFFAGAKDAKISYSRVGNLRHLEHPKFDDFGDAMIICDNNVPGYFRIDWFTPDGLGAWGDGRTFIIGDKGYIELRKYLNVGQDPDGDHVFWVNATGENHECVSGKCGFPFFGKMIRDCLDHTDFAMNQDYIFKVMDLAISAQLQAQIILGKKQDE